MAQIEQSAVRNHILAALSASDFALLAGFLRPVDLPLRQVLIEPDQTFEAVHFVERGIVSMLAVLDGGQAAEVGMIGREGLVGLPIVLEVDVSPTECIVQGPGTALRIEAVALKRALAASLTLRRPLLRYAQLFHNQVAQTAACNSFHKLEERLARWLLITHDRCESDDFVMTHEFLATMLGVRRAGVSLVASTLQKAGFITYARGRISVLDRPGLEAVSCECYGTVRRSSERILN